MWTGALVDSAFGSLHAAEVVLVKGQAAQPAEDQKPGARRYNDSEQCLSTSPTPVEE